jgi:hypothetical protein
VQWGEQLQVPADPEKAAILVSLNTQHFWWKKEERDEFINDANLEHAVEISRHRAATEEAGRLLMAAERQKLLELNAQRQVEAFARKQARLAQTEESRRWLAPLRGQRHRQAPASPAAMLHRQMCEARAERWARTQTVKRKNDDEIGPSRATTDD